MERDDLGGVRCNHPASPPPALHSFSQFIECLLHRRLGYSWEQVSMAALRLWEGEDTPTLGRTGSPTPSSLASKSRKWGQGGAQLSEALGTMPSTERKEGKKKPQTNKVPLCPSFLCSGGYIPSLIITGKWGRSRGGAQLPGEAPGPPPWRGARCSLSLWFLAAGTGSLIAQDRVQFLRLCCVCGCVCARQSPARV